MKNKSYRYGKFVCKTYLKSVGNGWEAGFLFDGHPVFVGNFIHATEANRWFQIMNREITKIGKRYTVGHNFPSMWFRTFVRNHLYRFYYLFLDKLFARYNREFQKAVVRDIRQYRKMKTRFHTEKRVQYFKKAA